MFGLDLGLVGGVVGAIGAIATTVGLIYRYIAWKQAKAAGRRAVKLEIAEREAARAKDRMRIDEDVGRLSPGGLSDELRDTARDR